MLSHCLVGLVSYCSNASGTKWYVDDSPHLVKNIFEHLFNCEPLLLLFPYIAFQSKTSKFLPLLLWFNIFSKSWFKNIFFENRQDGWKRSKFHWGSKALLGSDRRFGNKNILHFLFPDCNSQRFQWGFKKVDKSFYSGSLLTGSPVGSLELRLKGLMYSQATVTTHNIG